MLASNEVDISFSAICVGREAANFLLITVHSDQKVNECLQLLRLAIITISFSYSYEMVNVSINAPPNKLIYAHHPNYWLWYPESSEQSGFCSTVFEL